MDGKWRESARCRVEYGEAVYLELFFPADFEREDDKHDREALAKQICGECAVRSECLTYALVHEQQSDGVWGGLNKQERKELGFEQKAS